MRPSTGTGGILYPDAARAHFRLTRRAPSEALAAFVERHWIIHFDLRGAPPFEQAIVPHHCVNLAIETDVAAVHGVVTRRSVKTLAGHGRVVGAKFRPGAFQPLYGRPVHELNDRAVSLPEIFGPASEGLAAGVRAARDDLEAIALLESFLRDRLPEPDPTMLWLVDTMRSILEDRGITRVADLSARTEQPIHRLQRLFRHWVGVSPKAVIRRARIHEAAEILASGAPLDFASLSAELGYADQAHFIHDFKAQVGATPAAYARECAAQSAAAGQSSHG